jgi:predicted transposase YbfD/YdcC
MNNLFQDIFGNIKDPRVERTKLHNLLDIIALSIMGILAGAQSFEEIEDFGCAHEAWLKNYLELKNGIPSHDTMNRVFQLCCPEEMHQAFLTWLKSIKPLMPESIIPIDGKTLCGSHQRSKGLKALHVVSAWSSANGISLGQLKVDGKSNEIKAIPELLKTLTLSGAIVTLDAMGCQKAIVAQIVEQGADYVIGLKGNQGALHDTVRDCFPLNTAAFPVSIVKDDIECEHGRLEQRTLEVIDAQILQGLVDVTEWSSLSSLAKMTYVSEQQGKKTIQTQYYISSLSSQNPSQILRAIRTHWSIESMHWSLDVTFKEDDCRVRDENTALNLSILRKMSLSLLKNESSFKASIRRKQFKILNEPTYLLKVLQLI